MSWGNPSHGYGSEGGDSFKAEYRAVRDTAAPLSGSLDAGPSIHHDTMASSLTPVGPGSPLSSGLISAASTHSAPGNDLRCTGHGEVAMTAADSVKLALVDVC